jgi:ubiquinone biosynthesis protein
VPTWLQSRTRSAPPTLRLLVTGLRVAAVEALRAGRVVSAERAERESARAIAASLGELRGIYTKLGQQLALRADALPDPLRAELAALGSSAPPLPFPAVRVALQRAFAAPERVFRSIDPEPVGTASIAQVHRARLRDGTPVALKVRHAALDPERVARDVRALRRWLRIGGWLTLRPRAARALVPLVDDAAPALALEVDLAREGRMAEAIARDLADDPRLVVPRVHWQATTPRALALDFVPRVSLVDADALAARGANAEACAALVADCYARQVFRHGRFHADPHAGNVFLVDEAHPLAPPGGPGPRILLVDFGLSEELSEPLRAELRRGFHALLKRDVPELVAGLRRLGALVPGAESAATAALRAALEAGAADALGARADTIGALREVGKRLLRESGAFRVPRELLLLARTLANLYALCARIAPRYDPGPRILPHLLRFLS